MSIFDRFRRPAEPDSKRSLLDLLGSESSSFSFGGTTYPGGMQTTWAGEKSEPIGNNFVGFVAGAYKANGPVFSCIEARKSVLSEVRFQWQQMAGGKPGKLFGTQDLAILERPWPNGTTGDLVSRMEQHDSLAGNAYVARVGSRLQVLRPDWVQILVESAGSPYELGSTALGFLYWPGGTASGGEPVFLPAAEVAHYAPTPDPDAMYRGMSWITPVIREIQADGMATKHKLKFFENAATPNLAVSLDKAVTYEQFLEFVEAMDGAHQGVENAYKTLYLAGGADVTAIGADLRQMDFRSTQGAGETRIAAASRVPPIIAGFSEGLQSATYSNYGQARRAFADTFLRPHWRQVAGALESIVPPPAGARLWYDAGDVSFLQEDESDAAAIAQQQSATIRQLVDAGYTPDSVVASVVAGDMTQLVHSGLYSVQLQAAGTATAAP